jgi:hypothetical protein
MKSDKTRAEHKRPEFSRKATNSILKQTALVAIENGWTVETVAGVLNLSRRTIFRWLAAEKPSETNSVMHEARRR